MNKNLIYVVALDGLTTKVKNSDYSLYSINTWKFWCKSHDIDLFVLNNENLAEVQTIYQIPSYDFSIWFKEHVYEIGKGYDKIGIVDSDTMIRWDAPNIFDLYNPDEFCGVNDLCDLNWLFGSIRDRQPFFPDVQIDIDKYLNAGVLFFGNEHLPVFKELLDFYIANRERIDAIQGGGKEQTLLNFVLQQRKVNIKKLPPSWNLLSIHRKNMFTNNWQLKTDPTPYFIKYAYIWHFTGFPIEDRVRLMKQTWELVQGEYR